MFSTDVHVILSLHLKVTVPRLSVYIKADILRAIMLMFCLYWSLFSVPTLLLTKKSRTFPGPPWKIFQDIFGACEMRMFKYKEETVLTYNIQSVVHCRKFSMKQNVLHYCCLFAIWTTRKMHDFQGYFSRTFQDQSDFSGLSRSWNFQEKTKTFQEAWEPCYYAETRHSENLWEVYQCVGH